MIVKRINERIKIILLVFLTALVLIVLKIFYVQTFDYKKLSELAEDLWSRDLPLEASRGKIYDRNGIILADNLTTSKEGIFVAGDVRVKSLRQVATAVSDGAIAATEAIRYLNNFFIH